MQIFVGDEQFFARADSVGGAGWDCCFIPNLDSQFSEQFDIQNATCLWISTANPGLLSDLLSRLPTWLPIVIVGSTADESQLNTRNARVQCLPIDAEPTQIKECMQWAIEEKRRQSMREEALARFGQLTPRELEVVHMIAAGHNTKAVADELGISESTADKHRRSAFNRLHIQNNILEIINVLIDVPTLLKASISHGNRTHDLNINEFQSNS